MYMYCLSARAREMIFFQNFSNPNKIESGTTTSILNCYQVRMRFTKILSAAVDTVAPSGLNPATVKPVTQLGALHLRRDALADRTDVLVRKLKSASTSMNQLLRLDDVCRHLIDYPETRMLFVQAGIIPVLKHWGRKTVDQALKGQINECLALLGHVPAVKGRGIRLLAIDGGGTRGLMALEILSAIEALCPGYRIHQLFDYVVGVSTGAIIEALVAGLRLPIHECKQIYRDVSHRLFDQSRVRGSLGLLWSHSYYDTTSWVRFLRQSMGETRMLDTVHNPECPRLGFVSCVVNRPTIEAFVHRNYHHSVEVASCYPGSVKYKLWEALQASSAAPGYFEECRLDDCVHQDGGVLVNNPTAIGLHECKLLWPNRPIQCIVSIGTGRSADVPLYPIAAKAVAYTSAMNKLMKILHSATETELVHNTLTDLLSPYAYFRLNPYVSLSYTLDDNDPKRLTRMEADTKMYIRKNYPKLQAVASSLMQPKPLWRSVVDLLRDKDFLP